MEHPLRTWKYSPICQGCQPIPIPRFRGARRPFWPRKISMRSPVIFILKKTTGIVWWRREQGSTSHQNVAPISYNKTKYRRKARPNWRISTGVLIIARFEETILSREAKRTVIPMPNSGWLLTDLLPQSRQHQCSWPRSANSRWKTSWILATRSRQRSTSKTNKSSANSTKNGSWATFATKSWKECTRQSKTPTKPTRMIHLPLSKCSFIRTWLKKNTKKKVGRWPRSTCKR